MAAARGEALSRLAKATTPTVLGVIGVLLATLPLRLFEGVAPTPLLPLVVVYFWSIYGPNYLSAPSVFAIGLLQDLLSGGPIGLWPTIYLVAQFAVLSQRSYFQGRDQQVVWLGFAIVGVAAAAMQWLVMSVISGALLPLTQLAVQMLATIAVFPLISILFGHLHQRVIVEV